MRRLLAGVACVLVLAGCSGSLTPAQQLQDQTASLIDHANAQDAAGFQSDLDTLRATILREQQAGQISSAQAATLRRLLNAIESHKDLLTAPSPTPTPSPTASPTPSPTASPTPSPTPSATPTKSPTPSPTPSATPTDSPTPAAPPIGIGLGGDQPTPKAT